jgi:hypothetical protein
MILRVAALLALALTFPLSEARAACKCPPATPEELQDQATMIFNGEVADVRTERASGRKEIKFDVNDHLKGDAASEVTLTDQLARTECAIDFKERESYLVYLRWEWGHNVTSQCLGTKRLEEENRLDASLGVPDAAKQKMYDRLQVHCMGQPGTRCCLQSVNAMRRAYYLPEPSTGCPSGSVPDRLSCAQSYRWCVPATEPVSRPKKQ